MATVRLTFTTEDGVVFQVPVQVTATLLQLKTLVESSIGAPAASQQLMRDGVTLADGTVSSLGLSASDVILVRVQTQPSQPSNASATPSASALPLTADAMREAMQQFNRNASPTSTPSQTAPQASGNMADMMRAAIQQAVQMQGQQSGPSAAAVREQVVNDPELLNRVLANNPPMAEAILSNDLVTLQRMLDAQHAAKMEDARKQQERMARLNANPYDPDVQKQIEEEIRQRNVAQNLETAMEHNPEAFGRVVMLYVDCTVNGTPVKAFVDSGAQITVMSVQCAERCGIMRLVDKRFAGTVVGVGTSKVVGKVHIAPIQLGSQYYNSSFTIVESDSLEFLLGLDMLRKHQCIIDLPSNCLRIGDGEESVPFLAEKDIPKRLLEKVAEASADAAGASK